MNMKDKKTPRLFVIFLPVSVLLVLILILLYKFGTTSKQTAKLVVEDDLKMEVEEFSSRICEELDFMTRMGMSYRDMMSMMTIHNPSDTLRMIGTLCNNSNAYMVVYCDKDGIGVTQSGIKVNVAKDKFLSSNRKEQYYAYIQKEKIMQAEAVVSVIPVVKNEKIDGYILMYYSVSRIRKLFQQDRINENSFLLFSVDDGIIITTVGLEEELTEGTSLIEFLKHTDSNADIESMQTAMEGQNSISTFLDMNGKSKYVIYTPIGINDWYIAIGYEESLYNLKLTSEWGIMKNLITYLLILIFVFVIGMLAITLIMNIIYLKRNKNLQKEVDMDLLTGLYNKIATEREIKKYMEENPSTGAILFIFDIDDFKGINDSMGHVIGDKVLKSIGRYMRAVFQENCVVGRVGGDEFIIFTSRVESAKELNEEIQKVNRIFKEFPEIVDIGAPISASIGAAVYPNEATSFEELYKVADSALYKAKKNGKNQLVHNR